MAHGIISDIHADNGGLREVLHRLDTLHTVESILCAGDLTGYGKQPEAVVEVFMQRGILTVRGNHDAPTIDTPEDQATYLRSLPAELRMTISDQNIFMCHGIPGVNFIGITPAFLQRKSARELLLDVNADIIIAGHTHQILCEKVGQTWVLNPGSVFTQSDDFTSHSYGILDLDNYIFSVFDCLTPMTHPPINLFHLDA